MRAVAARALRWLLRGALWALAALVIVVLLLRWLPPPTTAFMLADRIGAVLEGDFGYRNRYDWVPLERISPQAALAVIASEDQRFPFHTGFDFESIRKAVRYNERAAARGHLPQLLIADLLTGRGIQFVQVVPPAAFAVTLRPNRVRFRRIPRGYVHAVGYVRNGNIARGPAGEEWLKYALADPLM